MGIIKWIREEVEDTYEWAEDLLGGGNKNGK